MASPPIPNGIFYNDFASSYIPEMLKEMYRDCVYDEYLTDKKDLVVMDVGANIGLFTQYIAPKAKKIYSIEPAQEHIDVLKYMIAHNHIDQCIPIRCAIGKMNGEVDLYHCENKTMHSLFPGVASDPSNKERVPIRTLASLFSEYDIQHLDVLKLDVEGFEVEIFNDPSFEPLAGKINLIFGEFHTWNNTHPAVFAQRLLDVGFQFSWSVRTAAHVFTASRNL